MGSLPVRRRRTRHATERFGEMALIGKTDLYCDVAERVTAIQEHFLSSLHSIVETPLIWWKPRRNLESARKLGLGKTHLLGEFVQANILSEMRFEEFKDAS
jgi:hypothetical protein